MSPTVSPGRDGLLSELIGESAPMQALRRQVESLLVRHSPSGRYPPLLFQGETGTGKSLLARAVHRAGARSGAPFVTVACAAIPETLIEAELFGYQAGAFTDARRSKAGLFETANGGVIFLDEIGLMPLALQAKLLTVVEDRSVRRLGATRADSVDVQVIAATNEDLAEAAAQGRFRTDLYHRLAALTFRVAPLRERGRDVLLLADWFLRRACEEYGLLRKRLTREAEVALLAYPWPGNVRELANVIERVVLLSDEPAITPHTLELLEAVAVERPTPASLRDSVQGFERQRLTQVLGQVGWNLSLAAAHLGMPRNTLRYRMTKLGLRMPDRSRGPVGREVDARLSQHCPPTAVEPGEAGTRAPAPGWELRQLTLLQMQIDPTRNLLRAAEVGRLLTVFASKVQGFRGLVQEVSGTEASAVFDVVPGGDTPDRAAHAAVAILKGLWRGQPSGSDMAVRMALHNCVALARWEGGAWEMDPGSRQQAGAVLRELLEVARPGTIGASGSTASLLGGQFELVPLSESSTAGEPVWLITGRLRLGEEDGSQCQTPHVGREGELAFLSGLMGQLCEGRGQVVSIVGEPGVGKSRLLQELRRRLGDRGLTFGLGRCVPFQSALPFFPAAQMLRQVYRVDDGDAEAVIAAKVRRGIAEAGLDAEGLEPYLLFLLGIPLPERLSTLAPDLLKRCVFQALRRIAIARSERAPLVIALDDLQWAGRTTEEFLSYLVDTLPTTRLMLLVAHGPGYQPPWLGRSFASQVSLGPLSARDARALVRALLPAGGPEEELDDILERARGNPFILEELARERASAMGSGRVESQMPPGLRAFVVAQVERLDRAARRLLHVAAVIGPVFGYGVLERALGPPGWLGEAIARLKHLELLDDCLVDGEKGLAFRRALMRDVILEGLPPGERARLRETVGKALAAIHPEQPKSPLGSSAGPLSPGTVAAQPYEGEAGVRGPDREAERPDPAAEQPGQAGEHGQRLPGDPGRERVMLELVCHEARHLAQAGRLEEARLRLLRTREQVGPHPLPLAEAAYHRVLARVLTHLGEVGEAQHHASMAAAAAALAGDGPALGRARTEAALASFWAGRLDLGLTLALEGTSLLADVPDRFAQGEACWTLALVQLARGQLAPALASGQEAETAARDSRDASLQARVAATLGWLHAVAGQTGAALDHGRRALKMAPDPLTLGLAVALSGASHLEGGDAPAAIPTLEEAAQRCAVQGARARKALAQVWLGESLVLDGAPERARSFLRDASLVADGADLRLVSALAQRGLGRAASAMGETRAAVGHLRAAVDALEAIGARREAERAHLHLAAVERGDGPRRRPAVDAPGLWPAAGG